MTTYIQPHECTNQHHYFDVSVSGLSLDIEPIAGTRCKCGKSVYMAQDKQEAGYTRGAFDIVKFNFREPIPGMVGVHIWKSGLHCTYMSIPEMALKSPLWDLLLSRVQGVWDRQIPPDEPTCQECGGLIRLNRRSYEGREFCALCGRDL